MALTLRLAHGSTKLVGEEWLTRWSAKGGTQRETKLTLSSIILQSILARLPRLNTRDSAPMRKNLRTLPWPGSPMCRAQMRRARLSGSLISLVFAVLVVPANCQNQLPPGEGKEAVQRICSGCHGVDHLSRRERTRAAWQDTVDSMLTRGAKASADEVKSVVRYLVETFGSVESEKMRPGKININLASATRLTSSLNLFPEEAEAITAYREKNGNFKEWRDLKKVPGVDVGKIEEQKDRLAF
ncbi:MAG: hypothetical protein EXQ58_09980 [Acidobacteria bacterium]|nr:hypothetical protein [Acidobacteriota bacterium]